MSQKISATIRDAQIVLHLKTHSNFVTILILPVVFRIAEYKT
jgi:hypothetical protein